MLQGEIWDVYLNPTKGSEQAGRRPVVVISGNLANTYLNVVIVCPLTTSIKNYKGNLIMNPNSVNGLNEKSEVLTFHIRSISKERFQTKIGDISKSELDKIKVCLDDILRM
jgi:mRNA interferase MazF